MLASGTRAWEEERFMLSGKFLTRVLLTFLLGGALALPQTHSPQTLQTPSETSNSIPAFRASSRLVVVNVVVADHNGAPISGLDKDDFQLLEDGKNQKIQVFEPHVPAKHLEPIPNVQLAPNEFTNSAKQAPDGAVNVVLFDILNTPTTDQMYARQQMIEFLKTLPRGQRVALFTMGSELRMVAGFTTSTDELIAAANKVRPGVSPWLDTEEDMEMEDHVADQLHGGNSPSNGGGGAMTMAGAMREFSAETRLVNTDIRVDKTFEQLGALARALSGYAGRKNLLWLSEAFPATTLPQVDGTRSSYRNYLAIFQRYSGLLQASQISVYPIDIRGLKNTSLPLITGAPGFHSTTRQDDDLKGSQLTMRDVAEQTGGRAFYNSNDLKGALQRSMEHGATYYTLAYVPQNHDWNGAFRHIKVQVERSDVALDYRRGYYAIRDDPSPADTARRMLIAEMQPGVPESTMLSLRVKVGFTNSKTGNVNINYSVGAPDIAFSGDPVNHAQLEFVAVAWDKNNHAAGDVSQTMTLDLKPETFRNFQNTGIPAHQELTLKPGTYKLRLGVMDYTNSKIGTLEVPVTVNNP
jgi:VWFA-related protein